MIRPTVTETLMNLAKEWARRSTCSSRVAVGAVLADFDGHVVASGYNGSPRGLPHCDEVGCLIEGGHCVRALHAEENAIIQCARTGVSSVGTTLYVTHRPCIRCARVIIQAGVVCVVFDRAYDADEMREGATMTLAESGIQVIRYSDVEKIGD